MSDQPMPKRIRSLPQDHRGFPIPWFVAVLPDGTRDFRVADPYKKGKAVRHDLCWVCGNRLGTYKAFVVGPMCVVSQTTGEPPCHLECAQYSAMTCPFLSKPRMKRNEKGLEAIGAEDPPGIFIKRNPGAIAVLVTRTFKTFRAPGTDPRDFLVRMGEPERLEWYAEGRPATREEVLASIESGFPLLEEVSRRGEPGELEELNKRRRMVEKDLLPGRGVHIQA